MWPFSICAQNAPFYWTIGVIQWFKTSRVRTWERPVCRSHPLNKPEQAWRKPWTNISLPPRNIEQHKSDLLTHKEVTTGNINLSCGTPLNKHLLTISTKNTGNYNIVNLSHESEEDSDCASNSFCNIERVKYAYI